MGEEGKLTSVYFPTSLFWGAGPWEPFQPACTKASGCEEPYLEVPPLYHTNLSVQGEKKQSNSIEPQMYKSECPQMLCSVAIFTCILKKFSVLVKHFPDGSKLLFDYRINLYMHTCVYINIMYINVCVCVHTTWHLPFARCCPEWCKHVTPVKPHNHTLRYKWCPSPHFTHDNWGRGLSRTAGKQEIRLWVWLTLNCHTLLMAAIVKKTNSDKISIAKESDLILAFLLTELDCFFG